jgi:hypothetical protein
MLQLRVHQWLLLSFAARGGHSAPSTFLLGEMPLNKDNFHPFGNNPHTILLEWVFNHPFQQGPPEG